MQDIIPWLGWIVAAIGLLYKLFGDRFHVEHRLTTIETKVDGIAEAVKVLADQGRRLAALEQRADDHCRRIAVLEDALP